MARSTCSGRGCSAATFPLMMSRSRAGPDPRPREGHSPPGRRHSIMDCTPANAARTQAYPESREDLLSLRHSPGRPPLAPPLRTSVAVVGTAPHWIHQAWSASMQARPAPRRTALSGEASLHPRVRRCRSVCRRSRPPPSIDSSASWTA
jgi:hypothetical protein